MYPHTSSLLPVLTGLMLVFTSCSSQDDPTPEPRPVHISLTASAGQGTRTVLANDGSSVHFQPDDTLSVFDFNNSNQQFTNQLSSVSPSATFSGELYLNIPKTLFAVYPFDADTRYYYRGNKHYIKATLPKEQTAVQGSFDPKANISVGSFVGNSSQSSYSVTLYNACALAEVSISGSLKCHKVVLSSVADTPLPLSGTRFFEPYQPVQQPGNEPETDSSSDQFPDVEVTSPSPYVSLVAPDVEVLDGTYYIALWPQTTKVSIELQDAHGTVIKKRTSKDKDPVKFARSVITSLGSFQ